MGFAPCGWISWVPALPWLGLPFLSGAGAGLGGRGLLDGGHLGRRGDGGDGSSGALDGCYPGHRRLEGVVSDIRYFHRGFEICWVEAEV